MSGTERSEYADLHWWRHEAKSRRKQWQGRHRAAVRNALAHDDWERAERPWQRTSGWLTH